MAAEKVTKKKNIYAAINAVMRDIGSIRKDETNDFDHYKFRGIDAVYNAIQPALVKNGVFIVPDLQDINQEERTSGNNKTMIYTTVKVRFTLYAEDGTSISGVFPGEAMDRSDKSTNKAMTAAYKYMIFELFTIPTEDNQDADKESPEAGKKKTSVGRERAREKLLAYFKEKNIKTDEQTKICEELKLSPKSTADDINEAYKKIKERFGE